MKKILTVLVAVFLCLLFTYAEGGGGIDTPIDGSGDGYEGGGSDTSYWDMQQGIRVTMYDKDGGKVGHTVDYTNDVVYPIRHYHKKTKVDYLNGEPTALDLGSNYFKAKPSIPLPQIINIDAAGESVAEGNARIEEIRAYFGSIDRLKHLVQELGTPIRYDEKLAKLDVDRADQKFIKDLKDYKLVIEPVSYFYLEGKLWAMTSAEAAKFPDPNGTMATWLWPLTHSNQPLSIFPTEDTQIGSTLVPAYTGARSGRFDNKTILESMGVGVITFSQGGNPPPNPKIITEDYNYRCDTTVITSFILEAGTDYTPDNYLNATFHFEGDGVNIPSVEVKNIFCPAGGSQIVWAKWRTPSKPKVIEIKITAKEITIDEDGNRFEGDEEELGYLSAVIAEDVEVTPPDPQATDRNDGFRATYSSSVNPFTLGESLSNSWSVWKVGMDADGNWEFEEKEYHASLDMGGGIIPSRLSPTAYGKTMRSGYGLEANIRSKEASNSFSNIVDAQRVKMYFPEFYYDSYNRILERKRGEFVFKKNKYSQEYYVGGNDKSRVHFTPLWYPDMEYKVKYMMYDCWTPAGELRKIGENSLNINGNMYQDWHIGPDYSK